MSNSASTFTPEESLAADDYSTDVAAESGFTDLADRYLASEFLPPTEWLTRHGLAEPYEHLRCIPPWSRLIKRSLDVCISLMGLILLFPLMLITAILVKLTSPGPVIFCQERVGLNQRDNRVNRRREFTLKWPRGLERRSGQERRKEFSYGRHFVLYKFRTMRDDAERNGPQFAVHRDPRVTSVGRFLRKARLDELPQLWNVLRGDMSLVGPRPERPEFIRQLAVDVPNYIDRLGLRPGLTGLAQVTNGYDNNIESFHRKVALDLLYMHNYCVWNDMKILFRTIGVVLTGKGAI